MKYFKINLGYSQSVPIDETELPKVIRAQSAGGIVYLKGGIVNTKHISSILPDYNRAIGWNDDYKPSGEDFGEIKQIEKDYKNFLESAENLLENPDKKLLE